MSQKRKILLRLLLFSLVTVNSPARTAQASGAHSPSASSQAFADEMQKLLDTWVQEFNAGHAEKVLDLYAPQAELLRGDGTVHDKVSILPELQKSIGDGAHDYVMHSLHREDSGDLGYDTGAFNVTLKDRVLEGNYVMVVKKLSGQWKIVAHATVANPRVRF